jgi:hypothetical protein
MATKESIAKTLNFLNRCKEHSGVKFNYKKLATECKVGNSRFHTAVKLGYFIKRFYGTGYLYYCCVERFETHHAKKLLEYERTIRDKMKKKPEPLTELFNERCNDNMPSLEIKPFTKPSIDEVRAYCALRKNDINPDKWYAHYEAVGWRVGNKTMKDWKAAVHTWEHNNYNCIPRKIETFTDMEIHEIHKKRGLIKYYTLQEHADEIKHKGGSGIIEMKTTLEF